MVEAVIVVPCYNEAERFETEKFAEILENHPEITLLFVDDGSRDNTREILCGLCNCFDNADLLVLEQNCGKGEAVRQGILKSMEYHPRFSGFYDADMSTDFDDMLQMLETASHADLYVSGCRLARLGGQITRSPLRHILGRVFASVVSVYLDLQVYDTQCGAKIFSAEIVPSLFRKKFATKWFFDVEILRRMLNIYGKEELLKRSMEFPLHCWNDKSGSKIRYFSAFIDFLRLLCSKD